MTRTSIFDYKFRQFKVRRSYTDAMWSWSMEVDKDYPVPPTFQPVQAVVSQDGVEQCILVGFPLTKSYIRDKSERGTRVTGYSYGWYVANRPLRPADRLLNTTTSGSTIIVEDPLLYASRLIHGSNLDNRCGLMKGGWDSSTLNWGTTSLPYQQFESTDSSYDQNAIDDINEYTGLFYLDDWKKVNGIWTPVSYYRNAANIDTGLNLPAAIEISASSSQFDIRNNRMMVDSEAEVNGDKWKNSVWVDGVVQDTLTGYTCCIPSSWEVATMGLERPYQYCFEIPSGTNAANAQALVTKRAESLFGLLTMPAETYNVKFFGRYDLKLMQKITFTGFNTIPSDPMRIIDMEYTIDSKGTVCSCNCMTERSWSSARKLALSLKQDWMAVSDTIKKGIESNTRKVVYGTITSYTNSGSAIMQAKTAGQLVYVSLPNQ